MYSGYVLFAFLFTVIYGRGFEPEKKRWLQGLRYGFLMGLFYIGTMILMMFPFVPYSNGLYLGWFVIGMFEFLVLGLIVSLLFKPGEESCSSDESCCH